MTEERQKLIVMSALKACQIASDELKAMGFEFRTASMDSEAVYYGLPGCIEQIRVATHGRSPGYKGAPPTAARITLAPNIQSRPDSILITRQKLTEQVHRAVGKYMSVVGPGLFPKKEP